MAQIIQDDYYGKAADTDNSRTLGQRLRDYYDPSDFVTIQNVDTDPIKYQFARPDDTETFSDYPGHKNTVQRRTPTVVILDPGETRLCPAYEADLMIENLIKQLAMKQINKKIKSGEAQPWQSADWTDPIAQDHWIKEIFIGKEDVVKQYNEQMSDVATAPAK